MKFKDIFFCNNRCSEIPLWSYFDEVIHVHPDASSRRHTTSRIIGLIDEAHFFQLFHVVSDCRRGYLHTLITNEGFTARCVATFDILTDDESENLDFSGIDGGFSVHYYKRRDKREKRKVADYF